MIIVSFSDDADTKAWLILLINSFIDPSATMVINIYFGNSYFYFLLNSFLWPLFAGSLSLEHFFRISVTNYIIDGICVINVFTNLEKDIHID